MCVCALGVRVRVFVRVRVLLCGVVFCGSRQLSSSETPALTLQPPPAPPPPPPHTHTLNTPRTTDQLPNFQRALQRFQREDPTFRAQHVPETGETLISGMGELHLDVYVERMRREYKVDCEVGRPKVRGVVLWLLSVCVVCACVGAGLCGCVCDDSSAHKNTPDPN